jgi:hypothetical protein
MNDIEVDPIIPGDAGATAESEDEKRKRLARDRKRAQRARDAKQKQAQATESERKWWERNRAALPSVELASLESQDREIRDLLLSMAALQGTDEELVEIVVDHVKENGTAHLGYITRAPREVVPADWPEQDYWKNPELLAALEAESDATQIFVRYGLLTALVDYKVVDFLHAQGWEWLAAAKLVGYVEVRGVGYHHR